MTADPALDLRLSTLEQRIRVMAMMLTEAGVRQTAADNRIAALEHAVGELERGDLAAVDADILVGAPLGLLPALADDELGAGGWSLTAEGDVAPSAPVTAGSGGGSA